MSNLNTKHTPGPWLVTKAMSGKTLVADQYSNGVALPLENFGSSNEANARLIAACPEMYEALKDYIFHLERKNEHVPQHLRDTLAKAEGRNG